MSLRGKKEEEEKKVRKAQHCTETSPHHLWLRATITAATNFIRSGKERDIDYKRKTGRKGTETNAFCKHLVNAMKALLFRKLHPAQHQPVSSLGTYLGYLKGPCNTSDKRFHSFLRVCKHCESYSYHKRRVALRDLLGAPDTPSFLLRFCWNFL